MTAFFNRLPIVCLLLIATFARANEPTPRLISPGVVSTAKGEYSPTFDTSRQELVFMRRTPGQFDYTLYLTRFSEDGWSEPEVLPFSGRYRDAGPSFSPDGNTLVFDSRRSHPELSFDSIDLWRTARDGTGWTEPELITAASVNPVDEPRAQRDEFGPLVTDDGGIVWYSFRRPFRAGAYYRLTDQGVPERLAALPDPSASTFVAYLTLSTDGRTAVIEGRATGRGDTDLFYACKSAGGWSPARPLDAANSTSGDGAPYLSADGKQLFFASDRPVAAPAAASSNLFTMATTDLPIPCD